MNGAQHGVVADGVIGGVEAGVAKPLMLGDVEAARLARIQDVTEAGEVEAEAPLAAGERVGGVDNGALEGEVGQPCV